MVVAVTADATTSNNGLYICSENDGSSASDWARVGTTYSVYGTDTDYGDGLVPAGASDGSGTGFLKEDGSWATPTGTTYTTFTSSSSGLVPAASGTSTAKFLTQAGSFVAPDTYGSGNSYAGGLMPAGTSDGSGREFLREDGIWATPTDTTYTAGTNVSIDSATNEISATDTTYTAGTNVPIDSATNEISATDTTYTAGANVSIDSATNEISATDTTYTAGTNVEIDSATNVISATIPTAAFDVLGGVKVGSGLTMTSGVLSADTQVQSSMSNMGDVTVESQIGDIKLKTGNPSVTRLDVDNAGDVSVSSKLTVTGAADVLGGMNAYGMSTFHMAPLNNEGELRFARSDAGSALRYHSLKTLSNGTAGLNYMKFCVHDNSTTTGQTDVMSLKGDGRVGILTSTPACELHVDGKARADQLEIKSESLPQLLVEPVVEAGADAQIIIRGHRNGTTGAEQAQIRLENYDSHLGSNHLLGEIQGKVTDHVANTGSMIFKTSPDGTSEVPCLTLNSSNNATFAGNVTVNGNLNGVTITPTLSLVGDYNLNSATDMNEATQQYEWVHPTNAYGSTSTNDLSHTGGTSAFIVNKNGDFQISLRLHAERGYANDQAYFFAEIRKRQTSGAYVSYHLSQSFYCDNNNSPDVNGIVLGGTIRLTLVNGEQFEVITREGYRRDPNDIHGGIPCTIANSFLRIETVTYTVS